MDIKDLITNPENLLVSSPKAMITGPKAVEKIGLEFFVFYCI
jgi:hypothetical protein